MISSSDLLADLKRQLAALERDLRSQSEDADVPWAAQLRAEHTRATERERTALTWSQWRDGEVSQAAVAWIIASTFVRFCEDNHLLDGHHGVDARFGSSPVWIAGPVDSHGNDRTARAVENQQAHYEQHRTDNSRDWLQQAFRALADLPAGRDLVDPRHNPVWRAPISASAADALLAFWRARDDRGALVHDFTDPDLGTRFLGDLYQELSEYAKKTYALLQTPEFVEEFILDRTLTPAIEEFGLDGLRLIDPTCGSGHFLLGAFARLDAAWQAKAPNMPARERVEKALDSVHGVDVNPFAVAIARFRLTVAALKASGDTTLTAAPEFHYHVAIGDSLLSARGRQEALPLDGEDDEPFEYASEDISDYRGILTYGQYHVVVGNPPYITPKDKALNQAYRDAFPEVCSGKYALSVPFMQLFFRLAKAEGPDGGAGHVGQITSNSFMKREFGKKLIENFLSGKHPTQPVDLVNVIDTSGAYIPGHGTPTVILVGRFRRPQSPEVRAVLGVRGEPGQPANPAAGLVWTEIVEHLDDELYHGTFITATDVPRERLATHPWSLSGGGASELKEQLESGSSRTLGDATDEIGIMAVLGEEEAYETPSWCKEPQRPLVIGEAIRDYTCRATHRWWPYGDDLQPTVSAGSSRWMWPFRRTVRGYLMFGKTREERGLSWYEYGMLARAKLRTPLSITFAFVATHNHFVLDRGGKVFKQSAPVIKLPADATEDDHLALLGVLNSSTACFWLKQVSHNKGEGGGARVDAGYSAMGSEGWKDTYEFTGTKLQQFPLPSGLYSHRGRSLDDLAVQLDSSGPVEVLTALSATQTPSTMSTDGLAVDTLGSRLANAHERWEHLRRRMIFEQEELDWHVYQLYGLLPEGAGDLTYRAANSSEALDTVQLGERAFEIALARQVAAGAEETAWFERHGSKPITELPADWPADYRALVERRLALIESDPNIRLLERPEYKRRWATTPWEVQQTQALREAALDRLERPELWRDEHGAVTLSVAQLADRTRGDDVLRSVLELLAGTAQYDPVATLTALLKDEAVPFLAAYRYKESGLTKFREWQQVWELQRREDAGEKVTIPLPPKYGKTDFRSDAYWKARGKLDVPKERFIAYPGVARAGDSSPVLGWAGWDHADQALALARAIGDMKGLGLEQGGVDATDNAAQPLVPLLAGLAELEPWLRQWHADVDRARGGSPADAVTGMLDHELRLANLTRRDLDAWRAPAATRGRKAGSRKASKAHVAPLDADEVSA